MTILYRAFDDRDRLLYVGVSDVEFTRLAQHGGSSQWAVYCVKLTFQRCLTREEAEEAERTAIADEDPVFNYQGRPTRRFLQWMRAYPDGDPDAVDVDAVIGRYRPPET